MRTVKFKDVLWAVAYKTGQDPQQGDFLTNQAIPIGHSISQWVRRLWPSQDWPEWTFTRPFAPNPNHYVPWDLLGPDDTQGVLQKIGKVFAVYLIDPATTSAPVETDFKLTPLGIHVGFQHGSQVWIKFTPPAPAFTAELWRAERVFARDEVTYLDRSGQCYRSRFNGNRGHEPQPFVTDEATLFGPPPTSDIIQEAESGQRGAPVQPLILDIYHIVALDSLTTGGSFIEIQDHTGGGTIILADALHTHVPGDTQISIITALYTSLTADPDMAPFTITLDTVNLKIRLSANLKYNAAHAGWTRTNGITTVDKVIQIQPYNDAIASAPSTPQKTEFQFTPEQLVIGATYTFTIVDPSGIEHIFEYTAMEGDSIESVMGGLALSMSAAIADDDYFSSVAVDVDNASQKLTITTPPSSVDAKIKLPGQPYWELVPFPLALFDPVVAGAKSDLEKEWGQIQEGITEEQRIGPETVTAASNFAQSPAPLTEQQNKPSRYKAA